MSSYRSSYYTSNDKSYGSASSSNYSSSNSYSNNVPPSRRPDGSYREEIRVRPGYVPEAERQSYVPPPARTRSYSDENTAIDSYRDILDDRVDSWADIDAPVLNEHNKYGSNDKEKTTAAKVEASEVKIEINEVSEANVIKSTETSEIKTEAALTSGTAAIPEELEPSGPPAIRGEPRKPSQLATAIDTAIDSLSIGSGAGETGTGAPRQVGRFAAQIACEEREGRTYAPRRYEASSYNNSGGHHSNRSDYQGYNRDNRSYSNYNNSNSNNWNRTSSYNNNSNRDTVEDATSASTVNASNTLGSSSGEIRVEKEFKSFLEQLNALRREMAVINAKLEYIRYFKNLDFSELTDAVKARVSKEKELAARMDTIFEAIEALALN